MDYLICIKDKVNIPAIKFSFCLEVAAENGYQLVVLKLLHANASVYNSNVMCYAVQYKWNSIVGLILATSLAEGKYFTSDVIARCLQLASKNADSVCSRLLQHYTDAIKLED